MTAFKGVKNTTNLPAREVGRITSAIQSDANPGVKRAETTKVGGRYRTTLKLATDVNPLNIVTRLRNAGYVMSQGVQADVAGHDTVVVQWPVRTD